jgi:hypothetical protein
MDTQREIEDTRALHKVIEVEWHGAAVYIMQHVYFLHP